MKSIALIGFMGSGKSTVGAALAHRLGVRFLDTDDIIEKDEGMTVRTIFETKGEDYFRACETRVLERLISNEPKVVACGGGIVTSETNRSLLKDNFFVIYLSAEPQEILDRLSGDESRPLIKGKESLEKIKEFMEIRSPFYEFAELEVPTGGKTPEQISSFIIELINQNLKNRS